VDVETSSLLTAGQTVCDIYDLGRRPSSEKNADVALVMDVDGFWVLMLDALRRASAASSLHSNPKRAKLGEMM